MFLFFIKALTEPVFNEVTKKKGLGRYEENIVTAVDLLYNGVCKIAENEIGAKIKAGLTDFDDSTEFYLHCIDLQEEMSRTSIPYDLPHILL